MTDPSQSPNSDDHIQHQQTSTGRNDTEQETPPTCQKNLEQSGTIYGGRHSRIAAISSSVPASTD